MGAICDYRRGTAAGSFDRPARWDRSSDAGSGAVVNRQQREHWLSARGFQNVNAIVGAAEEQDRPTIQRCCALTLNESSGGYNVYGEEGSTPQLYGRAVTEQNYKGIYLPNIGEGLNGIGPVQLTSAGYQQDANRIGGVWNAFCNCQVGIRILHELIERYGVWAGAMHYNGSGPAAVRDGGGV